MGKIRSNATLQAGFCPKCKGHTFPVRKDGRYYYFRGVAILMPANLLIPRCLDCSEEYLDEALQKDVEQILFEEYMEHSALITLIEGRDPRDEDAFDFN